MPAGRTGLPDERPLDVVAIRGEVGREHAGAVDPAAEVRRHGDVGSGGHDPAADLGIAGECGERVAERLLGAGRGRRSGRPAPRASARRSGSDRRLGCGVARSRRRRAQSWPSGEVGGEAGPRVVRVGTECVAQSASTCSAPSSAEWLRLSPANGRRQPLIVYAKIDGRPVASPGRRSRGPPRARPGRARRGRRGARADRRPGRRRRAARGRRAGPAGAPVEQPLARLRAGPADEDLVLLVVHVVDPLAQGIAAGQREPRLQPAAVLRLDGVPAGRREHRLDAPDPDARHDAVEALAIEVDDHRHVARGRRGPPRGSASQTLPSSSSASPTRATNRRSGCCAIVSWKWSRR